MADIPSAEELILVNSGQICEPFVGQHLLYRQPLHKQLELHYRLREKPSSNAEIDYVITCGPRIIPVEVKAGKTGNLRSLHQFTIEKDIYFAVKISSERPCWSRPPAGCRTGGPTRAIF